MPIVEGKEWNARVAEGLGDESSVEVNQPSAALNSII